MAKIKASGAVDQHIGTRIKQLRIHTGLTQSDLARRLGISYQQLHKYETGVNGISAGRLADMAQILNVSPSHFFEGLGAEPTAANAREGRGHLQFIKNFSRIENKKHREAIQQMIRALSEG